MARAKMPLNQTEIPVPPSPYAKAELTDEDKQRAYAEQMGREALERQRALAEAERTCSCGVGNDERRLDRRKPGCKKKPLKYGRAA